jgi:hypothetical protein
VRPAVVGIGENIGAALHTFRRRVFRSVQRRHCLSRQDQRDWFVAEARNDTPSLNRFIGIGRSQGNESGNGAQGRQMLHRLVCWPIFPDSD